jgi:HEAT repeat protein
MTARRLERIVLRGALGLALMGAASGPARAAPVAAPAVAPAGAGQSSLAVGFDAKGELRAAVCSAAPCSVEGGTAIGVPRDLAARREKSRLAVVGIGSGRRAIVVTVPSDVPTRSFEAVIAAPLSGSAPLVLFSGITGLSQGQDGLRHGSMVEVRELDANGARPILVGEQREDVTLCGRPSILAPRMIDARDLTLRPARVQRLKSEERDRAPRIAATRVTTPRAAGAPLLRAVSASSAVGNPASLTDGNAETVWAENRGGSGKGEFVVMNAPPELPMVGLEFAIRPEKASPSRGVSPKELWVVTNKQVFLVTLPEDAWKQPGARYVARFPVPIKDDCLAIAIESAWDERTDAEVTLSEVSLESPLAGANVDELVAALAGGSAKAESAKAVLRTLGQPAYDAILAKYPTLDEGGRRVALEVLDGAPCETSAPAFVSALQSPVEGQRMHAEARLPRCAKQAAPLLVTAMSGAKGPAFATLASTLAAIAPAEAVAAFVPMFDERAVERRKILRMALGRAAKLSAAAPAIRKVLVDPNTPPVALLDVLRALGPHAPAFSQEASAALARLGAPNADFRTRYLRVEPAGMLAARTPDARALLSRSLTSDADARVRSAAARAVVDARSVQAELVRALGDPEVRVRAEAARALGGAPDGPATAALLLRLERDPWPLVRAAAAASLGGAERGGAADTALGKALGDEAWLVRREVLGALGRRGARVHTEAIIERLEDKEERFDVRVAAARSLGLLCNPAAVGPLSRQLAPLADPYGSLEARGIAVAALAALRDIGPPDFKKRISVLYDKDAPAVARAAAEAALNAPTRGRCGR